MPGLRDHEPVVIEEFNGLWDRGDPESCPLDHFTQADNVQYLHSGVQTRDPIDKWQNTPTPLKAIVRIYTYAIPTGQTFLVLTEGGLLYHVTDTATATLILSLPLMQDFGFCSYNGRAYITPFKAYHDVFNWPFELGLKDDFIYVYKGDGTPARKAGGKSPINGGKKPFLVHNSPTEGKVSKGIHVIAVAFNGGVLGLHTAIDAPGEKQIQLLNIPIGPGGTTSRTIVMTPAMTFDKYKPTDHGIYTYYTVETINDNTTVNKVIDIEDTVTPPPPVYVPGAGTAPTQAGALTVQQDTSDGFCDFGFHLIGVVYETDTGYLTAPGPEFYGGCDYLDTKKAIKVTNIPISPDAFVKKRHLVSTKWIPEYNGDQKGYQFFFIPDGELDNNTATEKIVSYYDSDLLEDASHLMDNFAEIPAAVNLTTYHGRLVTVGEYGTAESLEGLPIGQQINYSLARLSAPGEPEAFNKVTGFVIAPLDGLALTNAQEFRDVLYLFKRTKTIAFVDNEDEPATWGMERVDEGIGAPVHGIGVVLDTGGVNIDYLIVADWSGLMLFNGTYARPELSWKIENFWMTFDRNKFRFLQVMNDSITKKIWITLTPPLQNTILFADYGNGLDPMKVKWAKWNFDTRVTTITITETNKLILGMNSNPPGPVE